MLKTLICITFLLFTGGAGAQEPDLSVYMTGLPDCYAGASDSAAKRDCEGRFADICMARSEGGGTTLGMTACKLAEMHAWDVLLNIKYRDAVTAAREQDRLESEYFPEFTALEASLRDAQRAWIAYRDANCALHYALWGSGSMRNIGASTCQLHMTAERTIELNEMFDPEN